MSSQVSPSHPLDTPLDHRSLLNVFGWCFTIMTVIIVITRLITRWRIVGSVGLDDTFILLAAVFAVCQTIAVSIAVGAGLGLVVDNVGREQLETQEKSIYAALILFVLSQSCSKVSVALFVRTLTPVLVHLWTAASIISATAAWTVIAIFGFAFSCDLPLTWNYTQGICINIEAFYTFIEVFSALIDAALVVLPAFIISNLQLASSRKFAIIAFFSSRTFVFVGSIVQIVYIFRNAEDARSFLVWTFVLILEIIQNLGIIAACGPYLKPLLENLSSGMIGNDDLRRRTRGSSKLTSTTKSYTSKLKRIFPGRSDPSGDHVSTTTDNELLRLEGVTDGQPRTQVVVTASEENESPTSGNEDAHTIMQTTSYQVSRG